MYKSLLFLFFLLSFTNVDAKIKLKEGTWFGSLHIHSDKYLPFELKIKKNKKDYSFTIHNGKEVVQLLPYTVINDSINLEFKSFKSTLRFIIDSKKCISGYWINHNKTGNYRIPFKSICTAEERFTELTAKAPLFNPTGNWKVTFNYKNGKPYNALGVFNQTKKSGYVEGTFLTETGDYRFLEGKVGGNQLNLSCFDGSHAFLFESYLRNDTLFGQFYSGKHWKTSWFAVRDENFSLSHPDSLTTLTSTTIPLQFAIKDIENNHFSYPNPSLKDKVVIIQIMGTWCPNCLDETKYYKMLHEKYNEHGLEIISVGYEIPETFTEQAARLKRLKDVYNLDFTFLVGGKADKSLASEHFDMLNKIISFPTSIYINKKGEVVRIHTGFNGPGTGEKYIEYAKETEAFIQSLLIN